MLTDDWGCGLVLAVPKGHWINLDGEATLVGPTIRFPSTGSRTRPRPEPEPEQQTKPEPHSPAASDRGLVSIPFRLLCHCYLLLPACGLAPSQTPYSVYSAAGVHVTGM